MVFVFSAVTCDIPEISIGKLSVEEVESSMSSMNHERLQLVTFKQAEEGRERPLGIHLDDLYRVSDDIPSLTFRHKSVQYAFDTSLHFVDDVSSVSPTISNIAEMRLLPNIALARNSLSDLDRLKSHHPTRLSPLFFLVVLSVSDAVYN